MILTLLTIKSNYDGFTMSYVMEIHRLYISSCIYVHSLSSAPRRLDNVAIAFPFTPSKLLSYPMQIFSPSLLRDPLSQQDVI